MKNSQKNKKKDDYNFNKKEEYKKYKSIGSASKYYKNYCEWNDYISEKYKNVSSNSLINFIAYLNKKARQITYRKERISNYQLYIAIIIPFIGLLLTLFITLQQNYTNIKQAIHDVFTEQIQIQNFSLTEESSTAKTFLDNDGEISSTEKVIEIREKAKNLQELVDTYSQTSNVIFLFSIIVCLYIILALFHYTKQLDTDNRETDFYNDYIKILEKMIVEKNKESDMN